MALTKEDLVAEAGKSTTPLQTMIQLAVGAASMCWEYPEDAGIFQSEKALNIATVLTEAIEDLISERISDEIRETLERME